MRPARGAKLFLTRNRRLIFRRGDAPPSFSTPPHPPPLRSSYTVTADLMSGASESRGRLPPESETHDCREPRGPGRAGAGRYKAGMREINAGRYAPRAPGRVAPRDDKKCSLVSRVTLLRIPVLNIYKGCPSRAGRGEGDGWERWGWW